MLTINRCRLIVGLLLGVLWSGSVSAQRLQRGRVELSAAVQNYFPLEPGNSWTYALMGFAAHGSVTVRVEEAADIGGARYYKLSGYVEDPVWLRLTREGRVLELRPDESAAQRWFSQISGRELLWYDFGLPVGASWESGLADQCVGMATIAKPLGKVEVPAGSFDDTLTVAYQGSNCADAGIQEEVFAAGVGLIRRTSLTIGGPRSMELISARVGSRAIGQPRLTFGLSIDQPVYTANLMPPVDPERSIPTLHAALFLENTTDQPLVITTPNGQQFELIVRNEQGDEIFRWSEGRFFTQAVTTIDLSPGEKVYSAQVPLSAGGDEPLPPGRYTVEGWITTAELILYRATTAFELKHVF